MAIFKVLLEIRGQLLDLWNIKNLSRSEEYNEKFYRMDYILWINKDAMILEFKDVKFVYPTEAEREKDYERIKEALDEHETVLILRDKTEKQTFIENDSLDDVSITKMQKYKDEIENPENINGQGKIGIGE
jgi:hypothetical protein